MFAHSVHGWWMLTMLQGSVTFKWAWNSTLNKFTAAPEVTWSCHLDVENRQWGQSPHTSHWLWQNNATVRGQRGEERQPGGYPFPCVLPHPGTYLRAFCWALLCLLVACQWASSGQAWEGLQILLRPWETSFSDARWGGLLLLSGPTARPSLSGSELVWEEWQHAQAGCQCRLRWNQSRCWSETQRQRNLVSRGSGAPSALIRELWGPAGDTNNAVKILNNF